MNNAQNNNHVYCNTISETLRFNHMIKFTNPTNLTKESQRSKGNQSKNDKHAGYEEAENTHKLLVKKSQDSNH